MAQNTMIFEPLQGLVQGALQGHQIHQMMLNAALDQEREGRRVQQQDREDKLADIDIQQKLNTNADLVDDAGMVQGSYEGVEGMVGKMGADQAYTVKADKGRTVEWGGKQYQLRTREQQREEHRRTLRGDKAVENSEILKRVAGEEEIKEPYRQGARESAERISREDNERATTVAQIQADRAEATAKLTRDATTANNKRTTDTSRRNTDVRAAATAKGKTDELNADQRRRAQEKAETQVDGWQADEQKLHTENLSLGADLTAGRTVDPKTGETQKINKLQAAGIQRKIADNAKKIKALQGQQSEKVKQFKGGAPAAAPAGGGSGTYEQYKANKLKKKAA